MSAYSPLNEYDRAYALLKKAHNDFEHFTPSDRKEFNSLMDQLNNRMNLTDEQLIKRFEMRYRSESLIKAMKEMRI